MTVVSRITSQSRRIANRQSHVAWQKWLRHSAQEIIMMKDRRGLSYATLCIGFFVNLI
jgi:hypothetical protein